MPLIISFAILAAFDLFQRPARARAIAIVKDLMIYITVFAAVIFIPSQLGGWSTIFAAVPQERCCCSPTNLGRLLGLRHAVPGLGDGAVPLSAFGDGDVERVQPPRHPAQRRDSAGLFVRCSA